MLRGIHRYTWLLNWFMGRGLNKMTDRHCVDFNIDCWGLLRKDELSFDRKDFIRANLSVFRTSILILVKGKAYFLWCHDYFHLVAFSRKVKIEIPQGLLNVKYIVILSRDIGICKLGVFQNFRSQCRLA